MFKAYLFKNILVGLQSRSIEKMLYDTQVQNVVSDGNADSVPGLFNHKL